MKMAVEVWEAAQLPVYMMVQKKSASWLGSGPEDEITLSPALLEAWSYLAVLGHTADPA